MKGLVITHPGLEAVSAKEVKELIGVDVSTERSVTLFDTGKIEHFCTLCYRSQSAIKVLALLDDGAVGEDGLDSILPKIKGLDLASWLPKKSFAVRSKLVDNDLLDTLETERAIGEVIYEKYSNKVDLEKPDITFFIYVLGDRYYFGVDFAGFDLSKRAYRTFALTDSIKGTVAYALLRVAGYKPDKIMLDPFCHSGTVVIEAAFYASQKPARFYEKDAFAFQNFAQFDGFDFDAFFEKHDKGVKEGPFSITASDSQQRFLKSAEKNAKIAGMNRLIRFTRMDIEWLDTKFEKHSVDMIVSNPPRVSRQLSEKGLDKIFQELFYTADFILKKDGRIVILAKNYNTIINIAGRNNFVLKANFDMMQGKEELHMLVFEKK